VKNDSNATDPNVGKTPKEEHPSPTQWKTIRFEGRTYSWTGKRWIDIETFTCPPIKTKNKLNAVLLSRLKEEDEKITDLQELLDRATDARAQRQYSRAEGLARKALQLSPSDLRAVAILSSCLRSLGKPEEALKESASYKAENYPPLITTRAAALCDLGRWEDAKMEISRTLLIAKKHSSWGYYEPFRVLNRIRTARPDLFKR
jgi:tetratricopeptide (TPR) repeat protein